MRGPIGRCKFHGIAEKTVSVFSVVALIRGSFAAPSRAQKDDARSNTPSRTLAFVNGQWFEGATFQRRNFYSVDGKLTTKKPQHVDQVTTRRR